MMEMKIVLAHLISNFTFHPVSQDVHVTAALKMTLGPRSGTVLVLEEKDSSVGEVDGSN